MRRREGSILPLFLYSSSNIFKIPFRRFHSLGITLVTVPVHERTKVTITVLTEL